MFNFKEKTIFNQYGKNQEIFIISSYHQRILNDSNQARLKTCLNQSLQNEED